MIRSEKLESFEAGTELLLFPYSAKEFERANDHKLLQKSSVALAFFIEDRLLCFVGLVRATLLSDYFLWFLLGKQTKALDLRYYKKLQEELRVFSPVKTVVETDFTRGERFATALGWKPSGSFMEFEGKNYQFFEVS